MTVGSWSGLTTISYSSRAVLVKPSVSVAWMRKGKESLAVQWATGAIESVRSLVMTGSAVFTLSLLERRGKRISLEGSRFLLNWTRRATLEPVTMKAGALARSSVVGVICA